MKRLVLLLSLMLALGAEADVLGEFSFEGMLGDRIPVRLKFAVNGDEIAVGEILYLKAKSPAPILVVGKPTVGGWYHLQEYQADGTVTGIMSFRIEGEDTADDARITEGTWTNPRTGRQFPMRNFVTVGSIGDVTEYLAYDDPEDIGLEYAYSVWNQGYETMMGGSVKFRWAGKYRLHFEVSNSPGNIAAGKSEPARPAVLGETTHDFFFYENVNECGYGFSAHFFKRFVVLRTTSGPGTLGCFGSGVAFDGVYIKLL